MGTALGTSAAEYNDTEVKKRLARVTVDLTQALVSLISASISISSLPSTTWSRRYWASVFVTRLCGFGQSLLRLTPHSISSPENDIWDSNSCMALARSIYECYLAFFYLCIDEADQAEWETRLDVFLLHDCSSRLRILPKFGDWDGTKMEAAAEVIRDRLKGRVPFQQLPDKFAAKVLRGETAFLLTQDEIASKVTELENVTVLRAVYEFFSSNTHSFGLSVIGTTLEPDRGTGRANIVDANYIALSNELAAKLLVRAETHVQSLFDDVPFSRYKIDWQTGISRRIEGSRPVPFG